MKRYTATVGKELNRIKDKFKELQSNEQEQEIIRLVELLKNINDYAQSCLTKEKFKRRK